ncbi:MAG TPA: serine/threonine-protein kinase [Haliangiales bacterium]|nr:serine/threonine-protein kinase [Haliangiales bacterium]
MSDYILGEELGRGALGRVVAIEGPDGERLAGKILHASHRGDPRAVERFRREAELLRGIPHPNLCEVRGLVDVGGEVVLLMERVDGPTLAEAIARDAPLAEARIAAIGRGVAAGLHAAHRAGLVHRDLKPANVLLAGDVPKVVDFGLARATSFAGVDRASFTLVGTPDYLAPEAIDSLAVDPRSDLYSLGCILYEMAAGRPPYDGATPFAVVEAHRSAPIPELPPGRWPRLAGLVRSLLAKSPADRPPSAAFVEEALGAAGALVPVEGTPLAPAGQCPHCGEALVPRVPVCFGCGRGAIRVVDGPTTVFVTGPGSITHKLDAGLRQKLCDWIARNPGLGLDPGRLTKEIPRVPFPLVVGIDRRSADELVAALASLGLRAEARDGGRLALAGVTDKARRMTGRFALVSFAAMAPAWQGIERWWPWSLIGGLAIVGVGVLRGWWTATRPMARLLPAATDPLPPALAERVDKLAAVLPGIRARRHREALRGVVRRAIALHAAVPADVRAEWTAELAEVIDVALVAAGRLDVLEERLVQLDLREPDAATARDLRERDTWAARLLEVTARLDALRARWASAAAGARGDDLLDDLRAQVVALEEVSRL